MRLIGLGVFTGTGLFLEIALTRYLSVLYYPPYVFTVISLAILGIGLGAALAAWRSRLRDEAYLAIYSVLAGAGTLVFVVYSVLLPGVQWLLFPLVVPPFFFGGLMISTVFSLHPQKSTLLYMIDLAGAGLGAVLAIPVMNLVGAQNALLVAALGFGVSGVLFASRRLTVVPVGLVVIAIVLTVGSTRLGWFDVALTQLPVPKPIVGPLAASGQLIETRWDAFARTDLIAPADGAPYQLFVDGAAGSVMPPAGDTQLLIRDIGFFPFATAQPQRVLLIGSGGGLDVAFGIFAGARDITAVEVNPQSVALVREYGDYNGSLYDTANVNVIIDEGRSVLRRSSDRYDLIFLSQVITETAERSGYALTENTIYTVEAFQDYLDGLTPTGQLALKLYDELTLTRSLSLAIAALQEQDLTDAEAIQHTAAFVDPNSGLPLLIVQKRPFTRDDAIALGAVAQDVGFVPLYLPGVAAQPPLDEVEAGTITFADVVADFEANIAATTDNRPFFFQFERGIPRTLLPMVIGAVGVLVAGAALMAYRARREDHPTLQVSPFYFACLGIGFICVEIAVIQQTRLFLGAPVYAVTVVLATILIGGGVGSLLSGMWIEQKPFEISLAPAAAVAVFVPVWMLVWNTTSAGLLGQQALVRFGTTIVMLLPLALLMGIPFPTGLRAIGQAPSVHIALAWAVNGVTTVIGSVAAVAVSILLGFHAVLWLGVGVYAIAAALAFVSMRRRANA